MLVGGTVYREAELPPSRVHEVSRATERDSLPSQLNPEAEPFIPASPAPLSPMETYVRGTGRGRPSMSPALDLSAPVAPLIQVPDEAVEELEIVELEPDAEVDLGDAPTGPDWTPEYATSPW